MVVVVMVVTMFAEMMIKILMMMVIMLMPVMVTMVEKIMRMMLVCSILPREIMISSFYLVPPYLCALSHPFPLSSV